MANIFKGLRRLLGLAALILAAPAAQAAAPPTRCG